MDAGVILAAGDSTRMGFPKQLAEIKDKPLLELVIEKVNSNFELSTVVLGYENELIQEKINFLREEKIALEDEKTKLQTDNKHIEEIARERYRMSKKGERVFKVIEKEEQN